MLCNDVRVVGHYVIDQVAMTIVPAGIASGETGRESHSLGINLPSDLFPFGPSAISTHPVRTAVWVDVAW